MENKERVYKIDLVEHLMRSERHVMKLPGYIKFEIKSRIGRLFFSRKPPLKGKNRRYLHLGCGGIMLNGWVNADFFKGIQHWRKSSRPDWMIDLRFPLNCADGYWDGVFTEHTIEHLTPEKVLCLLREVYRTLKTGCWLRISVPDLEKYVQFYTGRKSHDQFNRFVTGADAVGSLTQGNGHQSVWDSEWLGLFLREAGFSNVRKVGYHSGKDKNIIKEMPNRRWESLYMEAQKIDNKHMQ